MPELVLPLMPGASLFEVIEPSNTFAVVIALFCTVVVPTESVANFELVILAAAIFAVVTALATICALLAVPDISPPIAGSPDGNVAHDKVLPLLTKACPVPGELAVSSFAAPILLSCNLAAEIASSLIVPSGL